ncbi:MAG TPA: FixH family protein [Polyangiaceae bacterium]|nr:FixH family protein [Polyangiaceae bacterium]
MNTQTLRDNRWAFVPVGLLAAMFVGLGWMARVATNDPGFALERDYYAKAVRWDQHRAEEENDARLGYRLELSSVSSLSSEHKAEVTLRLVDAYGGALRGAHLNAEAFAVARSADVRALRFQEISPGTYRTELDRARAGIWELRCVAARTGERFTHTLRLELIEK